MNKSANSLALLFHKLEDDHVFRGSSNSVGTFVTLTGISKLKYGIFSVSTSSNSSFKIASMISLVFFSDISFCGVGDISFVLRGIDLHSGFCTG